MGYYASVDTNLKIKQEFRKKVMKDIKLCKKKSPAYLRRSSNGKTEEHPNFKKLREGIKDAKGDYVFYHIETMEINSENYIFWDEEAKFYRDRDLANYLKDKVSAGDLNFKGEDGEEWGYKFDGEGNVKRMIGETTWREDKNQ